MRINQLTVAGIQQGLPKKPPITLDGCSGYREHRQGGEISSARGEETRKTATDVVELEVAAQTGNSELSL